jgi:hypothetical protein
MLAAHQGPLLQNEVGREIAVCAKVEAASKPFVLFELDQRRVRAQLSRKGPAIPATMVKLRRHAPEVIL